MFCKNCGQEIDDKAVICPHCGVSQKDDSSVSDSGSIGWGFLGCCIPIVGLILFIVWREESVLLESLQDMTISCFYSGVEYGKALRNRR